MGTYEVVEIRWRAAYNDRLASSSRSASLKSRNSCDVVNLLQ